MEFTELIISKSAINERGKDSNRSQSAPTDENVYVCDSMDTREHKAYRYGMRRIQTAVSKCNAHIDDKTKTSIYQGKIALCASQDCYLQKVFQTKHNFEQMTLSKIQKHKPRDSPIIFIVSSSEKAKIEKFCTNIEPDQKDKKLVCVLVVDENGGNEKPVVAPREYGFLQRCSKTEQIACCVDDLLERHMFMFYENVLKAYFRSISRQNHPENDEVLSEAKALHEKFEVPLPDWLQQQANSVIDVCDDKYLFNSLKPVFCELKKMSSVFDIVPVTKHVVIKVLKASTEKETAQNVDAVRKVFEKWKIKSELFEIKTIVFKKSADYKYNSGDEINVRERIGTLSGFAKMVDAKTNEDMVAILSGHVAGNDPALNIKEETVGNILPRPSSDCLNADISVAKVSKETSQQCDKKFRNEDSERLNAVPLKTEELKKTRFERVHIWGAKSKPGIAQVKEHGFLPPEEVGNFIYLVKESDASSQSTWQQGDSGAMVLSERYRKEEDQTMRAIGLLMGESVEEDGKKYVVSPLQSGFDYLSIDHDATFSLYSDDSNEGE
ncbi:uncharacterized protein LOC128209808 [Mya arenaria]|uniref:uncharacterized protein LOC128209808 n=1 Tax=Mya arenaria TaxID=6604 RepID=UPI0022E21C7A|nr:uncharacterized protein LOC128209808 [Mya arenaria]